MLILNKIAILYFAMTMSVSSMFPPPYVGGHATAYCVSGVTASGEVTRNGICAGKKEWIGKTIILYQRLPDNSVGEMIGMYECLDTGGTDGIREGRVIDVWCPDIDSCQEFMNRIYEDGCEGRCYIQIVDAKG